MDEKAEIKAFFENAGFSVEDRDHFCYAYCKNLTPDEDPCTYLFVGKDLDAMGGSELPTSYDDKVYVELDKDGCVELMGIYRSLHDFIAIINAFAPPRPPHWETYPHAPVENWKHEVANDDTRLGYHEWAEARKGD